MANAGIIPLMVAHDYLAEFWQKVFTQITVHEAVAVRTGATIAVPFRKNSPKLAAELNAFVAMNGLGTAFGNVIEKRYLVNTTFATSAISEAERKKFLVRPCFAEFTLVHDKNLVGRLNGGEPVRDDN